MVDAKPLTVWLQAWIQCPTCRQGPSLDDLNDKLQRGVGTMGCGNCGKVDSLRNWVVVLPRTAHP